MQQIKIITHEQPNEPFDDEINEYLRKGWKLNQPIFLSYLGQMVAVLTKTPTPRAHKWKKSK